MTAHAARGAAKHVTLERERGVYDVQVTPGLAHIVARVRDDARTEQALLVFRTLADAGVPIFLIKLHRRAVSFAIDAAQEERVTVALVEVGMACSARHDLVIISVIARSMRDLTGVIVRVADALQQAGARLYGAGDSHNSVQCLVDAERVDDAVRELRLAFGLGGDDG